jgi:hypothetical protein
MLPDPVIVTYNSVAKSLYRTVNSPQMTKYTSADNEFDLSISHRRVVKQSAVVWRHEVILTHNVPNPTPDPFTEVGSLPVSFGYIVETTSEKYNYSVDQPLLAGAMHLFFGSYGNRLVSGES